MASSEHNGEETADLQTSPVEDAENRKALYARLRFALQGEPDPWRERADGAAAREFELLEA